MLGIGDEAIGKSIDTQLRQHPELVAVCHGTNDTEVEVQAVPGQPAPPGARWLNVRLTAIGDGRGRDAGCLVVMRDVTERRQMVDTIRTLSHTDELTGLLNRRGFAVLAEQQMRTSLRTRNRLWLLFADLDALKDINDRLGHEAGDRALREMAGLLRTGSFRKSDLVARLGGDEFAILATEIGPTDGDRLVQRVEAAVRKANEQPDRPWTLSVSTGVALFDPDRPQTLDELLGEADQRMYLAKQSQQGGPRQRT
jgi:diguanylate cyclase (GGDEF)-like protein